MQRFGTPQVLVDQPAEDLPSADLVRRYREGDYAGWIVGGAQAQSVSLVAAPGVAVPNELCQDDACVPFASDEHPVGAPGPCRPHEPLSDRVHARRLRRGRCHFDPAGGKDRVERGRELGISVPDQMSEPAPGLSQVSGQFAG